MAEILGISSATRRSLRNHIRFGIALVAVLVGGIGGWAATTDISGAVIAAGHPHARIVGRVEGGGPGLRVDP